MQMFRLRTLAVFLPLLLTATAALAKAKAPDSADVVVIGAGLSGLSTAYQLKKAGISYQLLELAPRIGGRVRTVHYHRPGEPEVYSDSGMEEYWASNPAVRYLKELKLPLQTDTAASSLVLDKKLEILGNEDTTTFLKRIFKPEELKSFEDFKTKATPMVQEILKAHEEDKPLAPSLLALKDVAFSKWVTDQGVPHRVAEWIRVSIECEIGTSWDRLSALDGLAEFHIFLGKDGETSYRVVGGNEKFTDALAKNVGRDRITLNARVNRVVSRGDGADVYYLNQATNQEHFVHARYVVSTIPLYWLFEVQFEPALSPKKRQAIDTQTYGSYFKAHFFVKAEAKKFWEKDGASFLPILSDGPLGVIYEGNPKQKTPTKIISLLVTGDNAEAFNYMNNDLIREKLKGEFEKLWPGFSKEILDVAFYRVHPRAIAGWPVGRSRYDELSEEIRRPENHVYLAGDFTEGTHSSGAFESAERVSRQIIAEEANRNKKLAAGTAGR